MNKDLEIIKKYRDKAAKHVITGVVLDCLNVIEAAAERMAAEIGRLKTQGKVACELFDELKISQKENFDLKAELEKRPEVVRCGECNFKAWCRKSINKDGHGDMCPLSFCSVGHRRESEEGK